MPVWIPDCSSLAAGEQHSVGHDARCFGQLVDVPPAAAGGRASQILACCPKYQ